MRFFTSLLTIIILSITSMADAPDDLGPAIGSKIPHNLQTIDQHGAAQNIDSLMGEKGLVLAFFRSAEWCPYCQMQLVDLKINAVESIRAKGYNLAAISYDNTDTLAAFHEKWSIDYPLLSDEGSVAIDAFGLRNPEYKKGGMAHGVPYPILFIINPDKVILKKLHTPNYRKRPPTADIIAALD